MKRLFLKLASLAVASMLVSACGGNDSGDDKTTGTMVDVATRGGFSALVLAADRAGLAGALRAPNANITLLAPTNDAFSLLAGQLGYASIQAMVDGLPPAALNSIVQYHVLPTRLSRADLVAGGGSQPTSLSQGGAVRALALSTTGGFKITDSVGRVAIVGLTDVPNDNGAFHVIDRVLVPPSVLTVLQTVRSNPERFRKLVETASAPALVTALNGAGPLTLFAPIDDAFKAVETVLPTLTANQIDVLLKYHVLGARVLSSDIAPGTTAATLATPQTLTLNPGTAPVFATITDTTAAPAKITAVDILASNGVVHVIDKVLQPALPAPN